MTRYLSRTLAPDAHATATALYGATEAERLLPRFGPMTFIAYGAACFIGNKPRRMPPQPRPEFTDSPLVSRSGTRLPLRALPWRELNRRFWSQGTTVFADKYERSEPRELTAFEKPVESMTLDELIKTQDAEPLSESRRSWLTRGTGVASLAPWSAYDENSIGATIVDPVAQAALMAIDEGFTPDDATDFADEASSIGRGIAYTTLDPISAKQIEFEQQQHGNGPVVRVTLQRIFRAGGDAPAKEGLSIATDRKLMPEDFMRLARSVKRTLATAFGACQTLDDLHARVDLIRDALLDSGVTIDFSAPDWREERERFLAPADPEWHSSFERVQPTVVVLSDAPHEDGCVNDAVNRDCFCSRPGCTTIECHRHERVTRLVHRSTLRSKDELWRERLFDVTAFELGTDGLVDPLVMF
jgi:hypothetical protein